VKTLQTNNTTLTTRIGPLEAVITTLTTANTNLTDQVTTHANAGGGGAAGSAAGGGAGSATAIAFSATPAIVSHQNIINYTTKVGTMIYDEGCEKLTLEFDMKSNGTVVFYITKLQAKCIKMGWHVGTQQIINFMSATGSTINIIH
jgi:hypothetical protein